MTQTITSKPSPNFDDRAANIALQYIVLHYTGMKDAASAITRMQDPTAKVSAHYVVMENGDIVQMVDEDKRAWHAGVGAWRGVTDINSASIGIELINKGHQGGGYHPYPQAQIAALTVLLRDIIARNNLDPVLSLIGHSDIAPTRKEDPGELFPWQQLASVGSGLWPEPNATDDVYADDAEVQQLLRRIGYDCPDHGAYDVPTRAALLAFQRRFEPNNLTGTPERTTIARLRAVVRQLDRLQA